MLRHLAAVFLASALGLLFVGAVTVLLAGPGAALLKCGAAFLVLAVACAFAAAPEVPSANPFDRENVDRQDEPRLRRPRDLSGRPVRR